MIFANLIRKVYPNYQSKDELRLELALSENRVQQLEYNLMIRSWMPFELREKELKTVQSSVQFASDIMAMIDDKDELETRIKEQLSHEIAAKIVNDISYNTEFQPNGWSKATVRIRYIIDEGIE